MENQRAVVAVIMTTYPYIRPNVLKDRERAKFQLVSVKELVYLKEKLESEYKTTISVDDLSCRIELMSEISLLLSKEGYFSCQHSFLESICLRHDLLVW